jgi:hypothetical protein
MCGMVNYAALGRELALDDKTIKAHADLLVQRGARTLPGLRARGECLL